MRKSEMRLGIAAGVLVVLCAVYSVSASGFTDISGHWAQASIEKMYAEGLVNGVGDGMFAPDRPITKAELAALINRAKGFTDIGEETVEAGDMWYVKDMAIAINAGYFESYDNAGRSINREEVAVAMSKLVGVRPVSELTFADSAEISEHARQGVQISVEVGFFQGRENNLFVPAASITRAEAVVLIDRLLGFAESADVTVHHTAYGTPEALTTVGGSLIIINAGTAVENVLVKGDLIISESVGDGDVTLKSVKVLGDVRVLGGGANSVECIDCEFGKVYISYDGGNVRVVIEGGSAVEVVFTADGKLVVSGEGAVEGVVIAENLSSGANIEVGGAIEKITVEAPVNLTVSGGSEVGMLVIGEKASGSNVEIPKDANVDNAVVDGRAAFTGDGSPNVATINASGVTAVTPPKEFADGSKATSTPGGSGSTGSGSSGSGSPSNTTVTLSGVSVNDDVQVPAVLTATPVYSGGTGTVTYKWYRIETGSNPGNDTELGEQSTYTLTSDEVGKYVYCVVTPSGSTTGASRTSNVVGQVIAAYQPQGLSASVSPSPVAAAGGTVTITLAGGLALTGTMVSVDSSAPAGVVMDADEEVSLNGTAIGDDGVVTLTVPANAAGTVRSFTVALSIATDTGTETASVTIEQSAATPIADLALGTAITFPTIGSSPVATAQGTVENVTLGEIAWSGYSTTFAENDSPVATFTATAAPGYYFDSNTWANAPITNLVTISGWASIGIVYESATKVTITVNYAYTHKVSSSVDYDVSAIDLTWITITIQTGTNYSLKSVDPADLTDVIAVNSYDNTVTLYLSEITEDNATVSAILHEGAVADALKIELEKENGKMTRITITYLNSK